MEQTTGRKLCGTARYVSLKVHQGVTPSRRDDLVALGYVFAWLLRGDLPWEKEQDHAEIMDKSFF